MRICPASSPRSTIDHDDKEDYLLWNRMKLCALSICLMWASSLRTAAYISSFSIHVPSALNVYNSCKSAARVVIEQEKIFKKCVDLQLEQCEEDLNGAIDLEMARTNSLSLRNTHIVEMIQQTSQNCTRDFALLHGVLEAWLANSQVLPIDDETCSSEDREVMMSAVFDLNVLRSEALAVSAQYSRESRNIIRNVVDYAKLRMKYDRDYIRKYTDRVADQVKQYAINVPIPDLHINDGLDKVEEHIENMMACLTLYEGGHCQLVGQRLSEKWKEHKDEMKTKLNELEKYWIDGYNAFREKTASFELEAWNRFVEFNNVFFEGGKQWIKAPPGASCGKACRQVIHEIFSFPVGVPKAAKDAYKRYLALGGTVIQFQPGTYFPDFRIADPNVQAKLEEIYKEKVWPKVQSAYVNGTALMQDQIKQMIVHARNIKIDVWKDAQNIKILPEDYNPPQYIGTAHHISDLDMEKAQFDAASEAFVQESTAAINAVANASNTYDQSNQDNFTRIPRVNMTSVKTNVINFDLRFERLMAPGIDFDIWFLKFTSISDLVFVIDFVFRIYFTIRMCYKYWRVTEVKIPKIDIQVQKEIFNPFKMSNGRIVVLFVSNPLIGSALGSIFLFGILATITAIYIPLYAEYRGGCIPADASGTFISENIYSSAYNLAYRAGSSALVKGSDHLDFLKSNTCSSLFIASAKKLNEDSGKFLSNSDIIHSVGNQMNSFEQCINVELASEQFTKACCNETGYELCDDFIAQEKDLICPINNRITPAVPYAPPGDYLQRQSCNVNLNEDEWKLDEDAIFDCTVLPECDISCAGPHKDKLRKVTRECSCITEWYLHSLWLRGALSFTIFAILNISRIIFIDGLGRVIWKKLHPGTFTVWATCDANGNIITDDLGKRRGKDDVTFEEMERLTISTRVSNVMRDRIERSSLKFRIGGYIMMLGSLLLNLIWILLIINASDATELRWLS